MVLGCENTEKTPDLQAFKGLLTLIVFFLRLQARASGGELIPVNPRGLWEILRNSDDEHTFFDDKIKIINDKEICQTTS